MGDAFADNYSSFEWLTTGAGSFDDPLSLHPTYYPGPSELGYIQLTLRAYGFNGCDPKDSDLILNISGGTLIELDIKVMMEGPYDNTHMIPTLSLLGQLPLTQPYNKSPWNYFAPESVTTFSSIDIVDWILVDVIKFIDGNNYIIVGRKTGLLHDDGYITDLDGSSLLTLAVSDTIDISVRVQHRNHLKVYSAFSMNYLGGKYTYDFTLDANQTLGDEYSIKEVTPGVWGMFSGNGNGDGRIDNQDKNDVWYWDNGLSGYYNGDFDMDGQVELDDLEQNWKPNSGVSSPIPE